MRELSIEEKARCYDAAVEDLRNAFYNEISLEDKDRETIEYIFPELKESEDEKIRKWIIAEIKTTHDYDSPTSNECVDKAISWLEEHKTSNEALQYLRENHSPSEMSDFQAAMNIAVAKAFDAGKKQGEQKPAWSEEDERIYKSITYSFTHNYPLTAQQQEFVESLKERHTWKPSDEQMDALNYYLENDIDNEGVFGHQLVKLYQDLKKLKG